MIRKIFFTNFVCADHIADARLRAYRRVSTHFWKRLLDALSWLVETSQLSIVVRNEANGRCLVSMFIPLPDSARVLADGIFYTYSA